MTWHRCQSLRKILHITSVLQFFFYSEVTLCFKAGSDSGSHYLDGYSNADANPASRTNQSLCYAKQSIQCKTPTLHTNYRRKQQPLSKEMPIPVTDCWFNLRWCKHVTVKIVEIFRSLLLTKSSLLSLSCLFFFSFFTIQRFIDVGVSARRFTHGVWVEVNNIPKQPVPLCCF